MASINPLQRFESSIKKHASTLHEFTDSPRSTPPRPFTSPAFDGGMNVKPGPKFSMNAGSEHFCLGLEEVIGSKQQVVEMNLRLDMDFQAAGQEGSTQRQIFIQDLKQDLADASGMGTSDFNILKVSPGSVVVDIDAPEKAAQEIHRQSLDPNSRLRSGKVTRFTDKITMPRVMQAVISSAVVAPSVDCKGQPQKKESTCDDEKEEIAEVRKEPHDSFALTSRRMNEEGLLSPLMRLTSVSGHCFCVCCAHLPYLLVSPFLFTLSLV